MPSTPAECSHEHPIVIQRQLGHVSLATTDTYLNHIAPVQIIEKIGKGSGRREFGARPLRQPMAAPRTTVKG